MPELSVVICAHNPKKEIFTQVLDALKNQDLPFREWELVIIDNSSQTAIAREFETDWHPNAKVVIENKLGLSHARLRGVKEAAGSLIVFVDDDNILTPNFLSETKKFREDHPEVDCFGGKAIPVFASKPPEWFFKAGISLGCRDLGDTLLISNYRSADKKLDTYPAFAPIGTGMIITKKAFLEYVDEVSNSPERLNLGRKGKELTSGEDNDIVLTLIKRGYEIAYVPSLVIHHIIPANRYSKEYLQRMAFESNRSWVKVLTIHNICPWKPISSQTLPLRKIKAYFALKAWNSDLNYINWRATCGKLTGLSEIKD